MHKSAIDYAIKRRINLGRLANGHYYICNNGDIVLASLFPTAKSAIVMMRKYSRKH